MAKRKMEAEQYDAWERDERNDRKKDKHREERRRKETNRYQECNSERR